MKRLMICLLLLANLSSGLAFAWDTHSEAYFGHNPEAVDLADQNSPSPGGDEHTDHHCCHGAAHLLVIVHNEAVPFLVNDQHNLTASTQSLRSLYIAPLLRPPIV